MGDTGIVRFPGNLDPRAQEFRPRNPHSQSQVTLVGPHQVYYPYPPSYASTEVQVVPFCDGRVGYTQFQPSPAYVRPAGANPPLPPPPLPPPSATPSRTLLLSSVPTDVSGSAVRRELEVFGEVRAVQAERLRDGIVTVHFYDLRHAQTAMVEIREQHMQQQSRLRKHYNDLLTQNSGANLAVPLPPPARGLISGRAVWAQFMIPAITGTPDGHNQGTLVIFNLDSEVSTSSLKDIFEAFGPVKELRETPSKRHQRFVEFYDIRDAARALSEMNGKEIQGKHVVIEFSRPGGHGRRYSNAFATTPTSINHVNSNINYNTTSYHARTSICPPPPPPPPPPPLPRKLSGRAAFNVPRSHLFQTQPPAKKSSFSKGNLNGNSTNSRNSSTGYVEASMASLSLGGAVGNGSHESNGALRRNAKKMSHNSYSTATTGNQQQQCRSGSRSWKGRLKNFDPRFLINEDAMVESNCRDSRTTVMIKNIPNKYSQKLLLNMLDNHCIHCNEQIADGDDQPLSAYDFVYLPIDFNNKCNVGYGFVNLTSPQATWRLYKAFHLQPWEVFNSRKICEVTYARLQGLEALKEHFKNSKFACETDEYLPVVFSPARDGRQFPEPLPIVVGHSNSKPNPLPPLPAVTSNVLIIGATKPDHVMHCGDRLEDDHDGCYDDEDDVVVGSPNGGDDDDREDHI